MRSAYSVFTLGVLAVTACGDPTGVDPTRLDRMTQGQLDAALATTFESPQAALLTGNRILDTGTPVNPDTRIILANDPSPFPPGVQFLAVQFTLTEEATVSGLEAFMQFSEPAGHYTMNVVARANAGGTPGSEIASKSYPLSVPGETTAEWIGFEDLGFILPAGTYWLALEPAEGSLFAGMPVDAPNPAVNAFYAPTLGGWSVTVYDLGWRIYEGGGLPPTDLEPPVVTVPTGMTVEATSSAGAVVTYSASATDNVDPAPVVSCDRPSGATFPLGSTVVTCSATDAAGNTATARFFVIVVDTTSPVLSIPADIAVDATSPSGAVVSYTVSASDAASVPTISCTPASGSLFAIGTHTVSCTATDASGNSRTGSFLVRVKGAEEQIMDLQGAVAGLDLPQGIETSLKKKLAEASSALALGERDDACVVLQALINQVNAQSGKKINAVDAGVLIAEAERIRTVLGC